MTAPTAGIQIDPERPTLDQVCDVLFARLLAVHRQRKPHQKEFTWGQEHALLGALVEISGESDDYWIEAVDEALLP